MAFSRNSLAAAFAGTLSLAVLTGCPGQPTNQVTPPPTTGSPTAAPTGAPTATTAPTTAPTDGTTPTAAPSVVPSKSPLQATTVQGKVYDETGALVSTGAKVMIKSLNPSNPFESTVDVVNGNYVANEVPAGVLVEVTATREGWTKRTKVETLLPLSTASQGNTVNFGGPSTSGNEDPYFISKYPEITSTEPAHEQLLTDTSKLVYKLTLSEPLNADNQRRFARSLRVWPVNQAALGTGQAFGGAATSVDLVNATSTANLVANYVIQEGSTFLTADNTASVTWDAAGQVATLTFNAPLKANKDTRATYAVGLISTTEKIADAAGDTLGLVNGAFNVTPNSNFLEDAFRKPELPTLSSPGSATARWQLTHNNAATFDLPQDSTSPTFASLSVAGANTLTVTYSEPMVAYGGQGLVLSNGVTNPAYYVIRVGEKAEDLADQKLDTATTQLNSFSTASPGFNYVLPTSSFEIVVSETDSKVVRIRRTGGNVTDKFPVNVKAVKVRVTTSVADPAGNAVSTSGDAHLKTSAI